MDISTQQIVALAMESNLPTSEIPIHHVPNELIDALFKIRHHSGREFTPFEIQLATQALRDYARGNHHHFDNSVKSLEISGAIRFV